MTSSLALTDLSRNYRKALIATPFAGGAGLLISSLLGHPVAGVMLCAGLVLGLINSRMVVSSTARAAASGDANKRRFMFGALRRLGAITVVAGVLVVLFRPDGIGVLLGLAVFQLLLLAGASGPLLREVRKG